MGFLICCYFGRWHILVTTQRERDLGCPTRVSHPGVEFSPAGAVAEIAVLWGSSTNSFFWIWGSSISIKKYHQQWKYWICLAFFYFWSRRNSPGESKNRRISTMLWCSVFWQQLSILGSSTDSTDSISGCSTNSN